MGELDKLSSSALNQVYTTRSLQYDRENVAYAEANKAQTVSSSFSAPITSLIEKESSLVEPVEVSTEQVDVALNKVNAQLQDFKNDYLRFERDKDTNKMVVYIKNSETDEMIMQIPSEDFLRIAKNIDSYLKQVNEAFGSTPNSMPIGLITDQQV